MKLNNKGFALTSVIYMLIVLFLMLMLLILANLATRKVVLDKIKYDVKQKLNQGGQLAQNIYTVTFDPTIGQINQTTKQVTYGEPYGELPTPTREGYKFLGWRGKNIAPEINSENYKIYHHESRTTSEFGAEDSTNFIRINGDQGTSFVDTSWRIYNLNKMKLHQKDYVFSFDVRSANANTQYITKKSGNTDGKTGIYVNKTGVMDNLISNIESNFIFTNDGEWHKFTSVVTIPYDTPNALIAIGNDVPNIYGENSYLDIKNIQLEEGNTATSYEPYQEYTSDTIVTKKENHTLYAMWELLYTVTFNPTGGTVSENSKYVSYNESYGNLPTPTRQGYTFLGWRGKNMIDDNNISGYYIDQNGQEQPEPNGYNWSHSDYIDIEGSKTYTFSTDSTSGTGAKHCVYDENKNFIRAFDSGTATMEMPSNAKYIRVSFRTTSNNVQLEEGNTATSYEPYQEYTSDTIVTKQENHTLYAMWEYDYTQYYDNIEYIKSNGNQYINLGYKPKTNTEVRLDIELIENANLNIGSSNNSIFGRETLTSNDAVFNVNFGAADNQEKEIFYWIDKKYGYGGEAKSKKYSSVTPRSTMIVKSGSATFQGETIEVATKTADNVDNMIVLGNISSTSNQIVSFNRYDAKVYGLQIYEGTKIMKNLIPVKQKSNNKPGLYDTVNNIFYPSNGNQDFLMN